MMIDGSTIASRRVARGPPIDYYSFGVARRKPHEFIDSFGALSRCLRSAMSQAYAALEMGATQAKILRHIGRQSRLSQADLARATGTDPALTGRGLETLIERGWVRRKRSKEDRRQYLLELTVSGQRARRRVEDARQRFAERLASALDEKDEEDFDRVVKKVLAALDGAGEELATTASPEAVGRRL
jgi:DNA-binding MarR family transcriptional regulator